MATATTPSSLAIFALIEGIEKGKYPLVHDGGKPAPYLWKLPGGKQEEGETPCEALYRELREEVGVVVYPVDGDELDFCKDLRSHCFRVVRTSYYSGDFSPRGGVEEACLFTREEIVGMLARGEIVRNHAEALHFFGF